MGRAVQNSAMAERRKSPFESFRGYLFAQILPSFLLSWQGVIAILASAAVVILVVLTDRQQLASPSKGFTAVAILLTIVIAALRLHYDFQRWARETRSQEERVRTAEKDATLDQPFHDFAKAQLRVVIERASLLMVSAEGRANMLYGVGTIMTLASVLAPVAAVGAYLASDPLPPNLVATLAALKDAGGKLPSGLAISTSRDWHVLLGGISFGFLFLAASAALFAQHRRQTEMVFLLGNDVDYFNRVNAAVEIAARADAAALQGTLAKVIGLVIAELLKRQTPEKASKADEPSASLGSEQLKQLADLVKQARGQ